MYMYHYSSINALTVQCIFQDTKLHYKPAFLHHFLDSTATN